MANIEIITGRTGEQHVLSIDDAELHRTLLGNGDFVLSTGEKFQARMNGANRVDIYQGTAIMQGRQVKIRSGSQRIETDAGVIGMKRQDAIVIEYEKVGDIETVELKAIKGPNNANAYVAPTIPYINGIIDLGEKHQMPLWYVRYDGLNFDSLIDARVVLNTTPIQTALDTATAARAQIEAEMNSYKALIESELNAIRNVVSVAPLTMLTGHNIYGIRDTITEGGTTYNVMTLRMPVVGYTQQNNDVFVVYLNGLRVTNDSIARIRKDNLNILWVQLYESAGYVAGDNTVYDDVEVEVWRPE